jgi:hypothetical protein
MKMEKKLDSLLRWHRQNAFEDGHKGECHRRALLRLKKTKTAKEIFKNREDTARQRSSDRLLRLYD